MRSSKFIILAALLLAGTAFYFSAASSHKNPPPPSLAVAAPPGPKKQLTAQQSFTIPSAPTTAPAGQTASIVASSESLRAVLPSVKEHPSDWRQFQPDTITVEPFPGMPVTFTRAEIKQEGKYTTWVGRNANIPGASLVGVGMAKRYDAIMILPGLSQVSVHVDPDGHTFTQQADPGSEGCGVEAAQLDRPAAMTTPAALYQVLAAPKTANDTSASTPNVTSAAVVAPNQVDVLFVYDAKTLTAAKQVSSDPVGFIDGTSKGSLESGNVVLAQSQVTSFQWRYVGLIAAPAFTQTNKLSDDLDAMSYDGEIGEWLLEQRYDRGADQVVLWHGGDTDFGGEAYAISEQPIPLIYAFAVAAWGSSYKTVIHELAHNFGCQHDRANSGSGDNATDAAKDGDGLYCYGQLWTNPAPIPNYPYPNTASTIMGYGSAVIPYYSNPSITLQITSALAGWPANVSDWGTQSLGVAIGQPRAAYNAKVLQDNGPAIAAFFEPISAPKFTQQPVSATVTVGQAFAISANVSGGGLDFTLYKDGQPLVTPTAPSDGSGGTTTPDTGPQPTVKYSKSAAALSDTGSYYIVATNSAGSATSNTITITVTTQPVTPPPTTTPPATGGGGGGGGGGAASLWFVGALSLLGFARFRSRRA